MAYSKAIHEHVSIALKLDKQIFFPDGNFLWKILPQEVFK